MSFHHLFLTSPHIYFCLMHAMCCTHLIFLCLVVFVRGKNSLLDMMPLVALAVQMGHEFKDTS